jgi:hypothetical protein
MAAGDVVSAIVSVPGAAGTVDFQPAAGVEVMVSEIYGTNSSVVGSCSAKIYDGTSEVTINDMQGANLVGITGRRIFINNSVRLRWSTNSGGASATKACYCGIQTK